MKVYKSNYSCNASLVNSENPLPQFRDPNTNFNVVNSEGVPKEYSHLMGFECGRRLYPYTKQDGYNRECKKSNIPSVVLENENLKATFLPSLGARLISLIDKTENRELLFANENLQMGNLAIRDAWFSGGIEWNIGQYGHSLTTSDDVFVSKQTDENNNEFLRIYEFERMHEIYWQIDFHLPKNSKFLFAKAYVYNLNDEDTSLYCWTNTALVKTPFTRVFSNTDKALFLNPFLPEDQRGYDFITLPYVDKLEGIDITYPKNFPYSSEYFFTSNHSKVPYEVTVEEDGSGFLDFSTDSLGYRKMFCWGEQPGGRHWEAFLSPSTSGEYFEAQSGAAASQLHGAILEKNSSFTFTQAFGSIKVDSGIAHNVDYNKAYKGVKKVVQSVIQENNIDIYNLDKQFSQSSLIEPFEILHKGSGFAYLDSLHSDYEVPSSFIFNISDIREDEKVYLDLLRDKSFEFDYLNKEFKYPPLSYHNKIKNSNSQFAKYLDAVIYLEKLDFDIALKKFLLLDETAPNCLISRNIAYIYFLEKDIPTSLQWYEKAIKQANNKYYKYICEEYSKILMDNKLLGKAKDFLYSLDKKMFENSDSLTLDLAVIAANFGDLETLEYGLFNRQLANIREGQNPFPYLYFEYKALKIAKEENREINEEIRALAKEKYTLPFELDFTVMLQKDE